MPAVVYEAAIAPDGWCRGDDLPAVWGWKALTQDKASAVLEARQNDKVFFNLGASSPLAARAYRLHSEQDGVWFFIAQVARNGNILVRAAHGMVLTLTVTGRTIRAASMAGNTVWEYNVPLEEHVRVFEARKKIMDHMHNEGHITLSKEVKCVKPDAMQPMRGNVLLVPRTTPIPRARPRRRSRSREPGQQTLEDVMGYTTDSQ